MFIDKYGLTNSKAGETGAENSLLWTLQHIILLVELGLLDSATAKLSDLKRSIDLCRIGQGLYVQNPSHALKTPNNGDKYMSPDQLIVIMMVSFEEGAKHHVDIFNKIKEQGYIRYNNMEDGKLRIIHPRDLALYHLMNQTKLSLFLLPILCIACIVSCMDKREVTSGKLLAWTKLNFLENRHLSIKITKRICDYIIKKKHGSWSDVFNIYFNAPHHPIAKLAKEVYGE